MQLLLQKYQKVFKKLRLDRAHGIAPHKPVLLLSVLQAFQNNLFTDKRIYITPELVALFKTNWSTLVITQHDCRFSLPYYHLTSDGFWKLIPNAGFENLLKFKASMRSFANLNAAVEYAIIEDDLLLLLNDKESNSLLQQFLLDEYFLETKSNFSNSSNGQLKIFDSIEGKILNEPAEEYRKETIRLIQQQNEEEVFLRGSLFKREIPKIYNNTCCISGMKIDAIITVSMIDACHIIPFSKSFDDTITNGIALCPNLHRAFDRGLIGVDKGYKVIVSKVFKEDETIYSLRSFKGKEILFPHQKNFYPSLKNFEWHKQNIFKG